MRIFAALISVTAVAGCLSQQAQCINEGTRDLRVVNDLITETRGNINRGYALETVQEVVTVRRDCTGRNDDGTEFTFRCDEVDTRDRTRPRAVDLNAERSTLESLLQRRDRLQTEAAARAEQCRALYPETS